MIFKGLSKKGGEKRWGRGGRGGNLGDPYLKFINHKKDKLILKNEKIK